ncbi:hypothetical protein D3C85_1466620 [compost metagenome]
MHHGLLIQRRHRQRAPAPITDADHILTALQSLLLIRRQTGIVIVAEHDVQRIKFLVHLRRQRRPFLARHGFELLDDERLQASGIIEVVGDKALVEDLDHQVRH